MLNSDLPSVQVLVTNLAVLSRKLDVMADKLDSAITTNTGDVTDAVKNIKAASASVQQLADGLQAGQGQAGSLLKDEKMKSDMSALLSHLNDMAEQYAHFGQTLNEKGIWKTLWTPKPSPTNPPAR